MSIKPNMGISYDGLKQIVALSCASRALNLRAIITSKILFIFFFFFKNFKSYGIRWSRKGKGNIEDKNDLGSVSSVIVLWERKWSRNTIGNKKLTR